MATDGDMCEKSLQKKKNQNKDIGILSNSN